MEEVLLLVTLICLFWTILSLPHILKFILHSTVVYNNSKAEYVYTAAIVEVIWYFLLR